MYIYFYFFTKMINFLFYYLINIHNPFTICKSILKIYILFISLFLYIMYYNTVNFFSYILLELEILLNMSDTFIHQKLK